MTLASTPFYGVWLYEGFLQPKSNRTSNKAYQITEDEAGDERQEPRQADEDDGPEGETWGYKHWGEPHLATS